MADDKEQLWFYTVVIVKDGAPVERSIRAHHHVTMGSDDTSVAFYLSGDEREVALAHGVVWLERDKAADQSIT